MSERINLDAVREVVKRHETAIGTGFVIGSPLYLEALNKVVGVSSNINPVTAAEIIIVGLTASFIAGSYRMRQKPSEMLSDMILFAKLALKKNNSQS